MRCTINVLLLFTFGIFLSGCTVYQKQPEPKVVVHVDQYCYPTSLSNLPKDTYSKEYYQAMAKKDPVKAVTAEIKYLRQYPQYLQQLQNDVVYRRYTCQDLPK